MAFSNSQKFYIYTRDGIYDKAKELLQSCHDIDILCRNGISVFLAIENKNTDLLTDMIDYYMKSINPVPEKRSIEECAHVNKLKRVLEDIEEKIDVPDEVAEVLKPYLASSSESEDEHSVYDEIGIENKLVAENFEFQIESCPYIDPQQRILEFLQDCQDTDENDILGAQQQEISAF